MNETRAVSLDVLKISGSNTVEVADAVRRVVDELGANAAARHQAGGHSRRFAKIRDALADVQLTIVLGAVLTIAIIYLFLNSWRSTVITGLTLPVSIISAFFIMWVFDFTVNTMTLLALSLAIGLLIDDAIVVRENIVRHLEMGKDHHEPRGRHRRDRSRRHLDDARRRRRVHPGRVHGRDDRQDLLPVRRHRRVRRARVAVRLLHARPDALERLGRSRSRARRPREPTRAQDARIPIRRFAFAFNDGSSALPIATRTGSRGRCERRWWMIGGAAASIARRSRSSRCSASPGCRMSTAASST